MWSLVEQCFVEHCFNPSSTSSTTSYSSVHYRPWSVCQASPHLDLCPRAEPSPALKCERAESIVSAMPRRNPPPDSTCRQRPPCPQKRAGQSGLLGPRPLIGIARGTATPPECGAPPRASRTSPGRQGRRTGCGSQPGGHRSTFNTLARRARAHAETAPAATARQRRRQRR